jgi:hypothetical protein
MIRAAIDEVTGGERIHDGQLVPDIFEHGRQNDLPPAAIVRFIHWEIYELRVMPGAKKINAGLVRTIVKEQMVAWAKNNGTLIHRLQMEYRQEEERDRLALATQSKPPLTSKRTTGRWATGHSAV